MEGRLDKNETKGARMDRGKRNIRRILDDARNTDANRRWYCFEYSSSACGNEIVPAKNGARHCAANAPLRKASEIPSPTKGSTKPAASPTSMAAFCVGQGVPKKSGDTVIVFITGRQWAARSRKAGCKSRTSGKVLATSARTMAHALMRDEPDRLKLIGCT